MIVALPGLFSYLIYYQKKKKKKKNENFQIKIFDIFRTSAQNMDYGYLLETP